MRLFCVSLTVLSALGLIGVAHAETVQGSYVEVRAVAGASCDAESQHSQAVLAWQIRQGSYDGEKLDGQTVAAIVTAEPSLGSSFAHTKTTFIIDERVSPSVQQALVHLAKDLAPSAIHDAGTVMKSKLDVRIAEGCGCGAAVVDTPLAKVRTRRLTEADEALMTGRQNEKPLCAAFSSNQTFAEQYSFVAEPTAGPANTVTAFAGSFSR